MLINSNTSNVIIWGIIQICKIFVYINGIAAPKSVEGATKKKKKEKVVLKVGSGGPPQKFFTEKGTKFGNSRHF